MRAISIIACGATLTFAAGPALADVFLVTTEGDHAVKGRIELSGQAFAVTPNVLLTALRVVGSAKDFKSTKPAGQLGGPSRTIQISEPGNARQPTVGATVGGRPMSGEVVVLIPDAAQTPMVAELLSACPLVEGGTYELRAPLPGDAVIGQISVLSAGQVTRFTAGPGWDDTQALGAPVFDAEGRVAGILTDAAPDGSAVEFTALADVADVLPDDAEIACDPRVDQDDLAQLESDVNGFKTRMANAETDIRNLNVRVETAEKTGNFAVDVLADVATDLEQINATRASGGDISPMLDSMKTRLQSLQLAPTVKTIDALLRRPDWSAKAKSLNNDLTLTFAYSTQLPGPGFSDSLRLCMRGVKPYKGSGGDHDFRTLGFYSRAIVEDAARVVTCKTTNVNIPFGRRDMGQYAFEVSRNEMTDLFEAYREANDWVPADYPWSGLTYAVLVKPGAAEGSPDAVILHMLIIPPDDSRPGALAVQCKLFENEQAVIDFLALDDWKPDETAFDDVDNVVLDTENTSDECVPVSVQ